MSVFDGFEPVNEQRKINSEIRFDGEKVLLSVYLADRFTYRDRVAWLNEIKAGRFILDKQRIYADIEVRNGMSLTYEFVMRDEPECDLTFNVLGADADFICVDKSGNLPTHPAGKYYKNTLWYLLQKEFGPCAPVNRLDRETSGVILFARSPAAASYFSKASIQKKYQVTVHGIFPEYLDAEGFIFNDGSSKIRKKRKFSYECPSEYLSENCRTIFRRIEYKNDLSLVEAELVTGRTHQIRATCCSLGFPVAGDKMYGLNEDFFLRYIDGKLTEADCMKLIYPHQALHAYSLTFASPSDGKILTFEAENPLKIV